MKQTFPPGLRRRFPPRTKSKHEHIYEGMIVTGEVREEGWPQTFEPPRQCAKCPSLGSTPQTPSLTVRLLLPRLKAAAWRRGKWRAGVPTKRHSSPPLSSPPYAFFPTLLLFQIQVVGRRGWSRHPRESVALR